MNDQNGSYRRLRHTATGALAALAAVGAIAGTGALAANPHAKTHGHAAAANGSTTNGGATKTPTTPLPAKTHTPHPVPQSVLDRRPAARQRRHDHRDRGSGPRERD
jgi:hypothetical protein